MAVSMRVRLAATMAAELHQREGRNLVAVGVFGSVGRGQEREYSDIDLLVVTRRKRPWIGDVYRDGFLVTVLQLTPDEAKDEVTGSRRDINAALGGWTSMRPLFDPSGLLNRLKRRAKEPSAKQFRAAAQSAFLEVYEDLGKLWNAIEADDEEEAREMAIWFTTAASGALFDLDRRVLPTGRRSFIEIRRYGTVGNAIRRLRYENLDLPETLRLSEAIWVSLLRRASREGIALPDFPRKSRTSL